MATSDGSIIIDTKLDTSGINHGSANMQVQMEKMAIAAETTANDIAYSFSAIDVKGVADGMSDSFSQESAEIEAILSNNETSAKSKAASIAAVYKKQGLSQSDAMKKAWENIERNSKTSSEKVEKTSKTSSKKIQKYIGDIATKSKSAGKSATSSLSNGISSVVKKIGVAIGSAFAVRTLVNFGKEAINLGSDLQEVQNVVDVTFTTMSEKVNEFSKNAMTSYGMSELVAKQYMGQFGAMSKAFGNTEQMAYDQAAALTGLAGDVASFYNLSTDEAFSKLKAVYTGEAEGLKSLGVVMTQTALDAFAMEKGFGKTTKQMTEQEKVALRYQFVLDQLSAASGDFVRTSDGWANQIKVLKLKFESFMATIGQGLINLLTPAVKLLNEFMSVLQSVGDRFKAWTEIVMGIETESPDSVENVADSMDSVSESAESANEEIEKVKGNLSGLDEIKTLGLETSAGEESSEIFSTGTVMPTIDTSGVSATSKSVGGLFDKIIEGFQKVKSTVSPLADSIKGMIDAIIQSMGGMSKGISIEGIIETFNALLSALMPILVPIFDLLSGIVASTVEWATGVDFGPFAEAFLKLSQSLMPILILLKDTIQWIWDELLLPLATWTIEEAAPPLLDALAEAFRAVSNILTPLVEGFKELWKDLEPIVAWIGDYAVDIIKLLGDIFSEIADVFQEKGDKVQRIIERVGSAISALWVVAEPILNQAKKVVIAVWGFIGKYISAGVGFIIDAIDGILTFLTGVFTGDWDMAWQGIKDVFSGAKEFLNTVALAIKRIFQNLGKALKGPLNVIIKAINGLVGGVVSGINLMIDALNLLSFDIPDWIPEIGGKTFGFNISKIEPPKIPLLAKGAVIPPNAPFAAVLGDQKHGTNIETPEALLRQIIREELGSREKGGNTYNITATAKGRALFELILSEARSELMRTGKNPFEFATT